MQKESKRPAFTRTVLLKKLLVSVNLDMIIVLGTEKVKGGSRVYFNSVVS